MNLLVEKRFGNYYARIPLTKAAKIVNGNALKLDWEEVIPKAELSYIIGNPPFYGKQYQSKEQKEEHIRTLIEYAKDQVGLPQEQRDHENSSLLIFKSTMWIKNILIVK